MLYNFVAGLRLRGKAKLLIGFVVFLLVGLGVALGADAFTRWLMVECFGVTADTAKAAGMIAEVAWIVFFLAEEYGYDKFIRGCLGSFGPF